MDLNISIDTSAIRALAMKQAREAAEGAARRKIAEHFQNGSWYPHKKGAGFLAIEQVLDDLICGDDIAEQTKRIIAEKWDAILEQQITYQLTRRAQKLAAAAIRERGLV